MKFEFRLRPILNVKTQKEDILKIEMAKALSILNKETKKLELMISELRSYMVEYKMLLKNVCTANEISSYNAYFFKQKEKIETQREIVNKAKENADKIREELISVSKEKKMLEKLEEKKKEVFNKMLLRKEQKMVDEIVSYRQNVELVEVK
ncbi:MAG TPA: flagellar export protein FliJ [Clostridiaceae bacterium]|nr:flagellar export protein FliJ [Clostridiaceae bacterium]